MKLKKKLRVNMRLRNIMKKKALNFKKLCKQTSRLVVHRL